MIESVLFVDPETAEPAGFCPFCGREIYGEDEVCEKCASRQSDDEWDDWED